MTYPTRFPSPTEHVPYAYVPGLASIPALTAILAAVLAARLAGSVVRRRSAARALWAAGLAAAGIAAAAEAYGEADGYGVAAFKIYYLAGGCLAVALLGAGSIWRVIGSQQRAALAGALCVALPAAAISVMVAETDPALLVGATTGGPPVNAALQGHAFIWAIALNTLGTLALVGVALAGLRDPGRRRAMAFLLAGLACTAGSGAMTRFGSYGYVYTTQAVGLMLLAVGFELLERRPRTARRRSLGVRAA